MQTLKLPAGHLAYDERGTGPAVLMIQGVGLAGAAWRPQVSALETEFRTISVDNRGVGGSDASIKGLSIEVMADDAIGICDNLGIDRFHLVGHSMGGLIAQAIALSKPERVLSLSLLCTFPTGPEGARLKKGMLWPAIRSAMGTMRSRRRGFLDLIFPRQYLDTVDADALAAEVGKIFGRDLARPPAAVRHQLRAMKAFDASKSFQALSSIRTLVASGEYDLIAPPSSGKRLAELIPASRFVLLKGLGHAAPIQNPQEINRLLYDHLNAGK